MSTENKELDALKGAADYYNTVLMLITQRIKYAPEEFAGVQNTIQFITNLRDQVITKIHEIEPPVEKKEAPLEMDLTHLTNEKPAVQVELN